MGPASYPERSEGSPGPFILKRMKPFLKLGLILFALSLAACNKDPKPTPEPSDDYVAADRVPVFYEANPKVFASSASLKAITGRLDNIKALGTDVLWLMPIFPVGTEKSIGSPYCVKDYKAVNPSYGTLGDLKDLVSAAHQKGMKVILDWVPNHTAWDNAWVTEHPDWYTQEDGKIISPKGMGWTDVADLNYGSTAMRAAMKEAMLYWMDEADIDGFRCDYADGVPHDFWKDVIPSIKAKKKDAVMLAEAKDYAFFNDGFDYVYGWTYKYEDTGVLMNLFSSDASKNPVQYFQDGLHIENDPLPAGKHVLRFTTNHDDASKKSPIAEFGSADAAMAAFVLTAFVGDSPLIYSSQEAEYATPLNFFNNNVINWNNASASIQKYQKVMSAYNDVSGIRKEGPTFYSTGDIVSIYYKNGSKGALILVNPRNARSEAKTPMERAGDKMKNAVTGQYETLSSTLSLGPYEYKIYIK